MTSRNDQKRDAQGIALGALNRLGQSEALDRLNLRDSLERVTYESARGAFLAAGAASKVAGAVSSRSKRSPASKRPAADLFDVTPTDEQQQILEVVQQFAGKQLRPAARVADDSLVTSTDILGRAQSELEVGALAVPESLGGAAAERSTVTNVLVAEALAHGDMGQAVAILAPTAVHGILASWGSEQQQSRHLGAGADAPLSAFAVLEPQPLFDPYELTTVATRTQSGYVLTGVKSMVPRGAEVGRFIIAASLDNAPALFLVEAPSTGLTTEPEPAMGLRAASTARVTLDHVALPSTALIGAGAAEAYADCIRRARLGWAALAIGTSKAVLDYVIPYVNEREAFGEPISHRQGVAFMVANIAIELEGARLATYRAAGRAERGKPFAREAGVARRLTSEYGMQIGTNGVQLLGGHGYVKEHPVERWYRDLRSVAVMEGVVFV